MHLASTAASSIAMAAPCAAKGSIACAASPNRATAPSLHWPPPGTGNSAHFSPAVAGADQHPRNGVPPRRDKHRLDLVVVAALAPAGPVPLSGNDGHHVDSPSSGNRIGDEMG